MANHPRGGDSKGADPSSEAGEFPAKATSPSGEGRVERIRSRKGIRKARGVFANARRRCHDALVLGATVRSLPIMYAEPVPSAITSAIMPATPSIGVECAFDSSIPATVEWLVVR